MRFSLRGDRFALDRLWPRRGATGDGGAAPARQQPDDAERAERLYWSVLRDVTDLIQPPPPGSPRRPRRRRAQ